MNGFRWPFASVNHLLPETEPQVRRLLGMGVFSFRRPFELLCSQRKAQKSFYILPLCREFSIFLDYFHYACEWRRPPSDLLYDLAQPEKLLISHCDYFMIV